MKKIVYAILIFFLAFCGSYFGYQYSHSQIQKPIIADAKPVIHNVKESSSLKEAIQKAFPSVVEIRAEVSNTDIFYQQSVNISLGSGVIVSEDGRIITNHHVIAGAKEIYVKTADGREYPATLIGSDQKTDLAVIQIHDSHLPFATLADSSAVEIGDDALVIGNPLGEGISVTNGIISALDKEVTIGKEPMVLIQTNAAVNRGNSGGGLFNIRGELIGIVNAKGQSTNFSNTIEGLGYAIPANTVQKIADDLLQNGYVKNRPTLGISLVTVTQQNNAFAPGLYITEVFAQSTAEKAGLQKYDQIIAVDSQEIHSYAELSILMKKYNVGDTIELRILRNNQEIKVNLTLQEASR